MLEFNRPSSAPAAVTAGVAEPARIAEAQGGEQVVAAFSLASQQASSAAVETDRSESLAAQLLDPLLAEMPQAAVLSEGSAEQWLQGMLGQRELQLQAREQAPQELEQLSEFLAEPVLGLPDLVLQPLPEPAVQAQGLPVAAVKQVLEMPLAEQELVASKVLGGAATEPGNGLRRAFAEGLARELVMPAAVSSAPVQAQVMTAVPVTPAILSPLLSEQTVEQPAQLSQPQTSAAPLLQQRLVLEAPQARWGEQMLQALRDSVEVQLRQQVQSASIRLDPPELGSMEIFLSHESGRLNVQISAANGEVARLLQQTSDRLRQELVSANFLQVNVQVGSDGQSQRQPQQAALAAQDEWVLANGSDLEQAASGARGRMVSDVLVTV